MEDLVALEKQGKFTFPSQAEVEKMDLIDIRRKIMKFCMKSQGAIAPCRTCSNKCVAGRWAVKLYDGLDIPKVETPVPQPVKPAEKPKRGRKTSDWYDKAKLSGDIVQWCVDNLGLNIQQAKKKVYMFEYNHFGKLKTNAKKATPTKKEVQTPVVRIQKEEKVQSTCEKLPMLPRFEDCSLADELSAKLEVLNNAKREYEEYVNTVNGYIQKVNDKILEIETCIELLGEQKKAQ